MPKRAAKDKPGSSHGEATSDEAILKERRRQESFDAADGVLGSIGWFLWIFGSTWFLIFSEDASPPAGLHGLTSEATLANLFCGSLVSRLARVSPKGTWSVWRRSWHMGWIVGFAALAVAFWHTALVKAPLNKSACWIWSLGCALCAGGVAWTYPQGAPTPTRGPTAAQPLARLVLAADGLTGVAIGLDFCREIASGALGKSAPFGPLAATATALPLVMLALAVGLSCSEAELLLSVPMVATFLVVVAFRGLLFGHTFGAAVAAAVALLHGLLYVPLGDPDLNIFYSSLMRGLRNFQKFMAQPVSGFGDSSED